KVIGVDSTPEMIWRSRRTAAKYGEKYKNVEFRLGEIEHLPIETESIDYAISNCVINLSPDKSLVFKEAFRILKSSGIFAVADITVDSEIPKEVRGAVSSWTACLSGALKDSEYERMLYDAGFQNVRIARSKSPAFRKEKFRFYSSEIIAEKPTYVSRKLGHK
ncbi:MAG TPA: methyltransferase domain-containing protein, partial [Nitrososphaerales archaeon]|nr:methyltransferase domain-containing protein [Nitrososphaerales archaeon]